jgi:hypothetical protein
VFSSYLFHIGSTRACGVSSCGVGIYVFYLWVVRLVESVDFFVLLVDYVVSLFVYLVTV